MTLREQIQRLILMLEEQGHGGDSTEIVYLGSMLDTLDNSREITEKITHKILDLHLPGCESNVVTSHNARVVLDD